MMNQRSGPCPCGRGPAVHALHEILSGRRWSACDLCWQEYKLKAAAATEAHDAAGHQRGER